MRTATVDRAKVEELLNQGLSTTEIGRRLGCTGQNIRLIRKSLVEQGKSFPEVKRGASSSAKAYPARRQGIKHIGSSDSRELRQALRSVEQAKADIANYRRERLTQLLESVPLEVFERALITTAELYPESEAKRIRLERNCEDLMRGKLALQQGDVNEPIGLPGKAKIDSDFTYHIGCATLILSLPLNINVGALCFN